LSWQAAAEVVLVEVVEAAAVALVVLLDSILNRYQVLIALQSAAVRLHLLTLQQVTEKIQLFKV
jgi:hypothetical protein